MPNQLLSHISLHTNLPNESKLLKTHNQSVVNLKTDIKEKQKWYHDHLASKTPLPVLRPGDIVWLCRATIRLVGKRRVYEGGCSMVIRGKNREWLAVQEKS